MLRMMEDMTNLARWNTALNEIHELVTDTINESGIDINTDQLVANVVHALRGRWPGSKMYVPSNTDDSDEKKEAPAAAAVASSPSLDGTLTINTILNIATQGMTLTPFVRSCLYENHTSQFTLSRRVLGNVKSSVDAFIERFSKFEKRGRDFGVIRLRVNDKNVLVLKYSDYGTQAINALLIARWPNLVHPEAISLDQVDVTEVDFNRMYKIRKGWMSGLFLEHYGDFGPEPEDLVVRAPETAETNQDA